MSLITRIEQRLRRDFFKWRYMHAARRILLTPPQTRGTLPFLLLSMVQKRDVIPYLVAAKSFARHANPSRIVVVCDPSIDDEDRSVFRQHIPHIELRDAAEFADPKVPRGGTWERLLAISEYVREQYVVQLDSDTVTVSPIPEVVESIKKGEGFVIGEKENQRSLLIAETSEYARLHFAPYAHIQAVTELKMATAGLPEGALYVRGCSGFTGFPINATMRDKLIAYSQAMEKITNSRWTEWGTEQITSNYLVANVHPMSVLPFPKYCTPDVGTNSTAFFHFIGYTRFVNSKYQRATKRIIDGLAGAI